MDIRKLLVIVFLSIALSACYLQADINTDQVGAKLNRNKILECVGPGVYTDWGFFSDIQEVSVSTLTFNVSDPEVATKDNQLVGVSITIQARRNSDCDSVRNILTSWSATLADDNLISTISATAKEGIKNGTRGFTLTELLNDRNGLAVAISGQLELDASKYSSDIINVTVENIALAPEYAKVLQDRALITAETDKELKRQDLIRQKSSNDQLEQDQRKLIFDKQLDAERSLTSVEVEIAAREGRKIAAANEVYLQNTPAFELAKLRLLEQIFGDKAVFYFIDPNTDLTLLLNSSGVVPVPVEQPATPPNP